MAFVTRSERNIKNELFNSTKIGPGEYQNDDEILEARLLHKISNRYSHYFKNNNLNVNVPFNTTSERSSFLKSNNNPGPGTYTNTYTNIKHNIKRESPSLNKEIIFVEENGNLIPKLKNEAKGFLSSEKRFNVISDQNNYENIGPGYYEIGKTFRRTKTNSRYGKIGTKRNYKISPLDNSVTTIPDKSRGEFIFTNGIIKEIKRRLTKGDELGPGQYNIYPKWANNALDWNIGLKKENKNLEYKKELINSLNKNNSMELKLNNTSTTNLNKSIRNISSNNLEENQNNIRNLVFNRFLKDRKKSHFDNLNKLKEYKDIILDIKFKDTPGPGFYDNKIIKGPISIFNTNKRTQNFGSSAPKFTKTNTENEMIGPGSYFLERNKYEPKFETVIFPKRPKKTNVDNNKDVGILINNIRSNNMEREPGPGQYDLEKDFIKKEVSKVKSFGILSERFKTSSSLDNNKLSERDREKNKYDKTNYKFEDKMRIKINSRYLELKKEEEKAEKRRRKKFMNIKEPAVGTYSPEIITSLSYNVLSKINPYQNQVAPFNIMNTRFQNQPRSLKKNRFNFPGPGKYEVADAYNALNNSKKNYNIFGTDSQRKDIDKNKIGPGLYDQSSPWNKKSFNILFMEK